MRHAQASKPRRGARHSLSIGLVAIGCTLAIAACASSGKASNSVRRNAFLAFSECMRSHGVPNCQGSWEFPRCDHGNSPPWERVESAGRMALMALRWALIR